LPAAGLGRDINDPAEIFGRAAPSTIALISGVDDAVASVTGTTATSLREPLLGAFSGLSDLTAILDPYPIVISGCPECTALKETHLLPVLTNLTAAWHFLHRIVDKCDEVIVRFEVMKPWPPASVASSSSAELPLDVLFGTLTTIRVSLQQPQLEPTFWIVKQTKDRSN
jgi:hypothetical protein